MRVTIKPIIKPVNNPSCNYREFDDVGTIAKSVDGTYTLHHENQSITVEFKLPENCYLIIEE